MNNGINVVVTVHIAVMDYGSGSIKLYKHNFKKDFDSDDIELYLSEHTDYKPEQCYFMFSSNEIYVEEPEVEE